MSQQHLVQLIAILLFCFFEAAIPLYLLPMWRGAKRSSVEGSPHPAWPYGAASWHAFRRAEATILVFCAWFSFLLVLGAFSSGDGKSVIRGLMIASLIGMTLIIVPVALFARPRRVTPKRYQDDHGMIRPRRRSG